MEENMRRRKILFIFFCFAISCGCAKRDSETVLLQELEVEDETEKHNETKAIFVYVCGAVKQEGVYELPEGSRVYEAVEKAGGFAENAASSQINQAEMLEDETRLYIPTIDELEEIQVQSDGKIDLNTASKDELMTLPGVGESKAALIVQYREKNGPFRQVEELMNISGIKEGLFSKIRDYIKV